MIAENIIDTIGIIYLIQLLIVFIFTAAINRERLKFWIFVPGWMFAAMIEGIINGFRKL